MQKELRVRTPLLTPSGNLEQIGWSPRVLLDCNLEDAHFYAFKPLQGLRIKRWDYYAIFTPRHFFSATIADLGYAANIFVYIMDFHTGELYEEGLISPFGLGASLPRNSTVGISSYTGQGASLTFTVKDGIHSLDVDWPKFNEGRGISARIDLKHPSDHESMNLVIPIPPKRFYFNRKINCLPASGFIKYGDLNIKLQPEDSLGQLDWGRGVWEYNSFWNWASASGFQADGQRIGLNLGTGFGDTGAATENAVIVDGKIHKLDQVPFLYNPKDYMQTWIFKDSEGRLNLTFTPFKDRTARTNLGIIFSEVHQLFGRYNGHVILNNGDRLNIRDLIGFAEEHHARW
ncbi:MAG: DUF2804 domain-containing protein [Candidatus Marinimicrobia bacterium]|nr:DUF2804 domain-containing protein [Candidatus Neomarinimicrobiota bacterium]